MSSPYVRLMFLMRGYFENLENGKKYWDKLMNLPCSSSDLLEFFKTQLYLSDEDIKLLQNMTNSNGYIDVSFEKIKRLPDTELIFDGWLSFSKRDYSDQYFLAFERLCSSLRFYVNKLEAEILNSEVLDSDDGNEKRMMLLPTHEKKIFLQCEII